MTAAATRILPDNQIPEAVEMEMSRVWKLAHQAPEEEAEAAFQDAAASLDATRKVSLTVHPECDAAVEHAISNYLAGLAHAMFIEPIDAEEIIAKAKRQGPATKPAPKPQAANGHTTLIEPPPPTGPQDYGISTSSHDEVAAPVPQPLAWIDISNWDREPVPMRKWAKRLDEFEASGGVVNIPVPPAAIASGAPKEIKRTDRSTSPEQSNAG